MNPICRAYNLQLTNYTLTYTQILPISIITTIIALFQQKNTISFHYVQYKTNSLNSFREMREWNEWIFNDSFQWLQYINQSWTIVTQFLLQESKLTCVIDYWHSSLYNSQWDLHLLNAHKALLLWISSKINPSEK